MDINSAINVINGSDRTADEKKHLRKLVRSGALVPSAFDGIPNFDEIIEDYPIESISILFLLLYLILNFVLYICYCNYEYQLSLFDVSSALAMDHRQEFHLRTQVMHTWMFINAKRIC
jgi:hypothetical protein